MNPARILEVEKIYDKNIFYFTEALLIPTEDNNDVKLLEENLF